MGGTFVCVYLCMCAHACARFSICVNDSAESRRSRALRLRNEPVANDSGAACEIPEAAAPLPLQR